MPNLTYCNYCPHVLVNHYVYAREARERQTYKVMHCRKCQCEVQVALREGDE